MAIQTEIDIDTPSDALLEFLDKLKMKISEDFSEINNTFFNLLDQVKEVEKNPYHRFCLRNRR